MTHSKEGLAKTIDHTLLKPFIQKKDIQTLCHEANDFGFYSVCIPPTFVSFAKSELKDSPVKVCTVIGFPLGASLTSVKSFEAKRLKDIGADELDMVINISALKDGEDQKVIDDIAAVVESGLLTKVIIETCFLSDEEKIKACELSLSAKADFVKTSTGFGTGGATLEDVKLMKSVVGEKAQVKASGGIKSLKMMKQMLEAGATRIGTSSGVQLLNDENASGSY